MVKNLLVFIILIFFGKGSFAQDHSIARQWNEVLLEAIRNDYARPTVHARNLFHTSVIIYDSWAVYHTEASTYFLGRKLHGFDCEFNGFESSDPESGVEETMSYAAYRLLKHRFENSPNSLKTLNSFDSLMNLLGYDVEVLSTNYSNGSAAALGNYLASKMIDYGLQDGSNEGDSYINLFYEPINPPLAPALPGNPDIVDVNRWQPLSLETFIDQSGNIIPGATPDFLSPEWGYVLPFAFEDADKEVYERDGNEYWVFGDPGAPPLMDLDNGGSESDEYRWSFELVSIWSSHLDPTDGIIWDVSPASVGNISELPNTWEEYHDFYDRLNGGDPGQGYDVNPTTGQPYEPQLVPRGDYSRVLAEFWADGPDSETPPGHWFTILNYVNDHPALVKKFKGEGDVIDDLEWDVKSYFVLGGAVHDAAIAAWSVKGWYDYIRPVSALRAMADRGQRTDNTLPNYDPSGISLVDGYIELVEEGDDLQGDNMENVGKVKLYSWRGPDYIDDPQVDEAGVGWILAENWWPYQRPSFVTPPFAGYVSGHSTYSRAGAEVLTRLTGDAYFPGGMSEFVAKKNEFLVFEEGPSVDVTLQWATYRDASDQCSLSRIWGGIHPPVDDIPGRHMGEKIGNDAFDLADKYFNNSVTSTVNIDIENRNGFELIENPVVNKIEIRSYKSVNGPINVVIRDLQGQVVYTAKKFMSYNKLLISGLVFPSGLYVVSLNDGSNVWSSKVLFE